MSTRLCNVVVDAADPTTLGEFWGRLLGWQISRPYPGEVDVSAPEDNGWPLDLVFVPVPEKKIVKNRLHLDLQSESPDHQASTVEQALSLGATHADIGQGNVPWVVLADPEGNEFCVLDPRPEYASTGALAAVVVDAEDETRLAEFWSEATGWPLTATGEKWASLRSPTGRGPWLEFVHNTDEKVVKNRVHMDVAPWPGDDQRAEVARLVELGARRLHVGQADEPWVVMADPEGGEFCVLGPR
jgi:hypothetical protein